MKKCLECDDMPAKVCRKCKAVYCGDCMDNHECYI